MYRGSYQYPDELNIQEKKYSDENPFLIVFIVLIIFFVLCWWAA